MAKVPDFSYQSEMIPITASNVQIGVNMKQGVNGQLEQTKGAMIHQSSL